MGSFLEQKATNTNHIQTTRLQHAPQHRPLLKYVWSLNYVFYIKQPRHMFILITSWILDNWCNRCWVKCLNYIRRQHTQSITWNNTPNVCWTLFSPRAARHWTRPYHIKHQQFTKCATRPWVWMILHDIEETMLSQRWNPCKRARKTNFSPS